MQHIDLDNLEKLIKTHSPIRMGVLEVIAGVAKEDLELGLVILASENKIARYGDFYSKNEHYMFMKWLIDSEEKDGEIETLNKKLDELGQKIKELCDE